MDTRQGTNWATFIANIESDEASVRIGIFKFPGWTVNVDGEEKEILVPEDERWGRMHVILEKGMHEVSVRLYNTPVRTTGNIISFVTWAGLLTYPWWRKRE